MASATISVYTCSHAWRAGFFVWCLRLRLKMGKLIHAVYVVFEIRFLSHHCYSNINTQSGHSGIYSQGTTLSS